jgi:plasmid stabilization system protein ParE
MRVLFRPEARAESIEARDWYESRAPGLGFEFVRMLEAALAAATRNPQAFAIVEGELRRVILRKFPYSLIFRLDPGQLVVIAVFHHRREPQRLSRRGAASS